MHTCSLSDTEPSTYEKPKEKKLTAVSESLYLFGVNKAYERRCGEICVLSELARQNIEGSIVQSVTSTLRTMCTLVYKRSIKREPGTTVARVAHT